MKSNGLKLKADISKMKSSDGRYYYKVEFYQGDYDPSIILKDSTEGNYSLSSMLVEFIKRAEDMPELLSGRNCFEMVESFTEGEEWDHPLVNSNITSTLDNTTVKGDLVVKGDCEVEGDLLVYGKITSISTVTRIKYNDIDIKTLSFTQRLKALFNL